MTTRAIVKVPDTRTITPIEKVAGENTPHFNLRDRPEFNGQKIVVVDAVFNVEGSPEFGAKPYCTMKCFVYPPSREPQPSDFRTVTTGADNVYSRILDAKNAKAFPTLGTLRKSGRAWFID